MNSGDLQLAHSLDEIGQKEKLSYFISGYFLLASLP
jgi:hypothetical protein